MSIANGTYTRTYSFDPDEGRMLVRFFIESIPDELASAREGRPIFKDQERVELMTPGNSLNIPVHIVTDEHRQRWPKQYEAFRKGMDIAVDGMPLEQWPILRRSQVLELKAMNFTTVEQLADMNDHATQRMMGGMRLRTLAKAFLDEAHAGAEFSRITAENERKDQEIAELKRAVAEQGQLLDRVSRQLVDLQSAPNPIQTFLPASVDPMEALRRAPEAPPPSSLADLPAPRRRGRPPSQQIESGV